MFNGIDLAFWLIMLVAWLWNEGWFNEDEA